MATMPGETQQEKPRGQPNEGHEGKTSESTKQQYPIGHQTPGGAAIQPGQTYETPEPKRRADDATNRQEPSKNPERAPEHQPGYEAKHQKEAKGQKQHDDAHHRSQADDHQAEVDARNDENALHQQKGVRARTAHRKADTKRSKPAKKPVRKHK
jgi:hypothetical protein